MTLYFFAFLSGLVTIFAPCIWPLLPIILSSGVNGGHKKPLGIVSGISVSFLFATLALAYVLRVFPVDPEVFRTFGVIIILVLGATLLVPKCTLWLEGKVSKLSSKFGVVKSKGSGFWSGFVTGAALGLVWSPCAGPILATVATVAATQGVSFTVFLIALFFVLGVSVPLFGIALLGQKAFARMRGANQYTGRIQQAFGVVIILAGLMIYTGYDKVLQAKFLAVCGSAGSWLTGFEESDTVKEQLQELRGKKTEKKSEVQGTDLKNLGAAPELTGINDWLNTEGGKSLSLEELRGKVVLIDFWTYSCINCIRTLPYVQSWYEKYEKEGFVVIGVHTPEFLFEHKKENVADAIKKYGLTYPVAQDNDYATWQAFENRYWPAHYLIDTEGNIRYTHFGEGKYEQTEAAIRTLLEEGGKEVIAKEGIVVQAEEPGSGGQTKETYLGADRLELGRFASQESPVMGTNVFTYNKPLSTHKFGFSGEWNVLGERSVAMKNAGLSFAFKGKKVFLVMSAETKESRVRVLLDGKSITDSEAGSDVIGSEIKVVEERLYELVDLEQVQNRTVELEFLTPGIAVYAFTFS